MWKKKSVKHALKTEKHNTGTALVESLEIIITKHGAEHYSYSSEVESMI